MNEILGALSLSLLCLTSHANISAIDANNDGQSEAFYDSTSHLLWSDSNVWGQQSLANANALVTASNIEGMTTWALPTIAQFNTLFSDFSLNQTDKLLLQGVQPLWYWSTDVDPTNSGRQLAFTFSSGANMAFSNTLAPNPSLGRTAPYVWAVTSYEPVSVSSVPEPETFAMLLAGLALITAVVRRRARNG